MLKFIRFNNIKSYRVFSTFKNQIDKSEMEKLKNQYLYISNIITRPINDIKNLKNIIQEENEEIDRLETVSKEHAFRN
jgi:archaellum component FlaC